MNNLMEKIAKVLNLKGHYTGLGEFKEWLHGPCDIEGHQVTILSLFSVLSENSPYLNTAPLSPCSRL